MIGHQLTHRVGLYVYYVGGVQDAIRSKADWPSIVLLVRQRADGLLGPEGTNGAGGISK